MQPDLPDSFLRYKHHLIKLTRSMSFGFDPLNDWRSILLALSPPRTPLQQDFIKQVHWNHITASEFNLSCPLLISGFVLLWLNPFFTSTRSNQEMDSFFGFVFVASINGDRVNDLFASSEWEKIVNAFYRCASWFDEGVRIKQLSTDKEKRCGGRE